MKCLSIVVSVYNEEDSLARFLEVTTGVLQASLLADEWGYELVFVNDGSADQSRAILDGFAEKDKRCKTIHFSRNFGHEAAMIAGIDHAQGDFIVCMDADLQNPPELIPEMVEKFLTGSDVVLMARAENKDAGVLKKLTSGLFYGVLNVLSGVKFDGMYRIFLASRSGRRMYCVKSTARRTVICADISNRLVFPGR